MAAQTISNPRVKPSTIHGMGLFAERDYEPNEFVTSYGGLLVDNADKAGIVPNSVYMLKDIYGDFWDATLSVHPLLEKGKWINDTEGHPELTHNTIFVSGSKSGQCPLIVTSRSVKEGEEFFIRYGEEYWQHHRR